MIERNVEIPVYSVCNVVYRSFRCSTAEVKYYGIRLLNGRVGRWLITGVKAECIDKDRWEMVMELSQLSKPVSCYPRLRLWATIRLMWRLMRSKRYIADD